MRILYIDLASHQALLSCVTEASMEAFKEVNNRVSDGEVVPLIDSLIKEAGWKKEEITGIACVVGPGGFTSLRVAVACANAMSFALDVPTCGIHLSDLYAARMNIKDFVWLHSTKKKEIFIRGFGKFAEAIPEAKHVMIDQLPEFIPTGSIITGELIPEHQIIVDNLEVKMAGFLPFGEVLPKFLSEQKYQKQTLQPWYGRMW